MSRKLRRVREASVWYCSNKKTVLVNRKLAHVLGKAAEYSVLKEVLLDVRGVERGHDEAVLLQVFADSGQRFLAREITHDRDDQISPLQVAHEFKILFRRQEVSELAVLVRLLDEFFQIRKPTAAHSFHSISNIQSIVAEVSVHVIEARLITLGQLHLEGFFDRLANRREVRGVCALVGRCLANCFQNVGYRSVGRGSFVLRDRLAQ